MAYTSLFGLIAVLTVYLRLKIIVEWVYDAGFAVFINKKSCLIGIWLFKI